MKSFIIGFDISKEKINFCLLDQGIHVHEGEVVNTAKGLQTFTRQMKSLIAGLGAKQEYEVKAIMEFTGIYNNLLLNALLKTEFQIYVVHASNIKSAGGIDRLKNDKVDARKIAEYGFRFGDKMKAWNPLDKNVQLLKILSSKRKALIKMKKSATQSQADYKKFHGANYTKLCLQIDSELKETLEKNIRKIEQEIERLIAQDSKLNESYKLMQTVPGIGPVTALALLVLTDNMVKFKSAKQLACYCGVVPFERSSGIFKGKAKVSHMANKELKTLLHMGSTTLTKTDTPFGHWYRKKISEGKNPMSVLNALRNKMLITAFACVKSGKPYSPQHVYSASLNCG